MKTFKKEGIYLLLAIIAMTVAVCFQNVKAPKQILSPYSGDVGKLADSIKSIDVHCDYLNSEPDGFSGTIPSDSQIYKLCTFTLQSHDNIKAIADLIAHSEPSSAQTTDGSVKFDFVLHMKNGTSEKLSCVTFVNVVMDDLDIVSSSREYKMQISGICQQYFPKNEIYRYISPYYAWDVTYNLANTPHMSDNNFKLLMETYRDEYLSQSLEDYKTDKVVANIEMQYIIHTDSSIKCVCSRYEDYYVYSKFTKTQAMLKSLGFGNYIKSLKISVDTVTNIAYYADIDSKFRTDQSNRMPIDIKITDKKDIAELIPFLYCRLDRTSSLESERTSRLESEMGEHSNYFTISIKNPLGTEDTENILLDYTKVPADIIGKYHLDLNPAHLVELR